ncbi:uncharacterized protein LOC112083927 [Eutrema salsugineum]|uniref:uncharacterized protein LOC112083927 n=1 Tax=Eutrema salsugineum TaxID=72664 RepID=UPI000CED78C3|nr:uncharacterized protein LOC112083927 [Eutrema salsugineum]
MVSVVEFFAVIIPQTIQLQTLFEEIDKDVDIQELKAKLLSSEPVKKGFILKDDRVWYKNRLLIPQSSSMIPLILHEFHDAFMGGHSGVLKTLKRIQGLLQPLPIPDKIWKDISLDFVEELPSSNGINVILVVVDRLSKYSHFIGLKHPFTATKVASKFISEIVRLHGFLRPGLDILETTPFHVVYGREPPTLLFFEEGSTANFELEKALRERDTMLTQIKEQLTRAQDMMKSYADKHRRDVSFEMGDMVYLKLQPYRQHSVTRRLCQKLAARFYGPFEVIEKIGKAAYRLKLPASSKIHPVFHVSQLKAAIGSQNTVTALPETFTDAGEFVLEPDAVLETRFDKHGGLELLITWKDLPQHEATWFSVREFERSYPTFALEDTLHLKGAGIDRFHGRVYERQRKKNLANVDGENGKGEEKKVKVSS